MKDDRILKPRLRLCPFCGASGAPELETSGIVAFVRCNVCCCDGPVFDITGNIRGDYSELSREEKNAELENAMIKAKHDAVNAWNGRSWEGAYFPEELEDLDRKMKLESGAIYGRSVTDPREVVRCKDCKHLSEDRIAPEWNRICRLQGVGKSDNGYCDEYERKED